MRSKVLPKTLLLVCLWPIVCSSQTQPTVPDNRVVMEITTTEWGMIGDDCTKLMNFRLFADWRLEYEICQHKNLAAGRAISSPLRKELRITEKQVAAFK